MSCHVATARAAALSAAFVLLLGSVSRVNAETTPVVLPPSFQQIDHGPAGGTVWQGRVPDPSVPKARRLTIIYLPPAVSSASRYPVVYLLHGFRGSPYEYAFGLHLAALADREIDGKAVRPFIAVAPPAGVNGKFHGEWSRAWEDYVVHDIVPWVDGHLASARARAHARRP
jgi:enterochelin esterase-like enzyme